MEKKKDPMEQLLREDILMEAEKIKKEVKEANEEAMPSETKDRIKEELRKKRAEREKEKLYAKLPEEDRRALELGREILKKQEAEKLKTSKDKVVYIRKPKKMYLALAAVVVLVLAMGVTSVGGPKRVVEMMKGFVGEREIVQIDTTEDNYIVGDDREEEAYQNLRDVFGVEPVKIIHQFVGMKFVTSEIDEELQTALLIYDYQGGNISYFISTHHTNSSWGIDTEDKVIDEYYIEHEEKGKMKVIEYESEPSGIKSYSTKYTHEGMEYILEGMINRSDFEELVRSLKFF